MQPDEQDHWDGPHELNPRERLWLRFAFASNAAIVCILAGFVYGGLIVLGVTFLGPWLFITASLVSITVGAWLGWRSRT